MECQAMPSAAAINELDARIRIVRENIRELVEQASAYSGAANEEAIADRISQQESQLATLLKERDDLAKAASSE
jgi:hypothetical protein